MKREKNLAFPDEGFVRLPQITHALGICETSWWNGVKSGKYPPAIKLAPRTTVWRVEDIRELIAKLGKDVQQQMEGKANDNGKQA